MNSPHPDEQIRLIDGTTIPQLGFGAYKVDDAEAEATIGVALSAGYRMIDTARMYGNEAGVGRAVRASGLSRDEVYITTKLWNDDHGRDRTRAAFDASAARLDVGVLDLFLIHWPCPTQNLYAETWRMLIELQEEGRVCSVGVSNFTEKHLHRIIDDSGQTPVLNQVELHPYFQQPQLRAVHRELGIATQAWSPLGRGTSVLDDPVLTDIAVKHSVTTAQVVLRWHLELGTIVIPKSATPERIRANRDVFDFALPAEDHTQITNLDRGTRIGPDPDVMEA